MKILYPLFLFLLVVCHSSFSFAQEAIAATGGTNSGAGGIVNFTVGQLVYTTYNGSNGAVAQGVQNNVNLSVSLESEHFDNQIILSAFPNPASNYLTLKLSKLNTPHLRYELVDLKGSIIEEKKLTQSLTTIKILHLTSSTYFLRIKDGGTTLKIFKIIKT